MVIVINLNQNIMEVQIYGYLIKVTVSNDWGVSSNINTDDVNHPCSIKHGDKLGIIWKPTMGKQNIEDKFKGLIFRLSCVFIPR